jgi:hypothetical protein
MKRVLAVLAAAGLSVFAPDVHASPVTINFDGLDGGRDGVHVEQPDNFYNGGLGSRGSGPGPNLGVTFRPIDATSGTPFAICNVTADCAGHGNSLFIFGDESNGVAHGAVMHIDGGFRGVIEFDAASSAPAFIFARTKVDAGNISAVITERPDERCGRLDCPFVHYRMDLTEDVKLPDDILAHDVVFATRGVDALFIDNITFSDLIVPDDGGTATAVPEPSSAAMIGGVGLIGAALRRRRAAVAAVGGE